MPDDELPQLRYWQDADAEALAPRLDRGTLTGCLGILCVLLLPVLLALPLSDWRVPLWVARLVPLLGVAALALGAWLLAHVPPRVPPHSTDPEQPLTRMGKLPVQERPATRANHLALALVAALAVAGALGYLLADTEDLASGRVVAGTVLSGAAGCALIGYGWLVGRGRAAPPAWRWVRAHSGSRSVSGATTHAARPRGAWLVAHAVGRGGLRLGAAGDWRAATGGGAGRADPAALAAAAGGTPAGASALGASPWHMLCGSYRRSSGSREPWVHAPARTPGRAGRGRSGRANDVDAGKESAVCTSR
jgi:hypothetical protein